MIILSLFDGMSCGQIALNRAGIKYKKYYASEIDKYAIHVTQKNYPETIQLGNIENWKTWDIEQPDIIMGGSPCQGFSFAGKGLNFDDPRSKLFFVFVGIIKHYKPKYFLLENVIMRQEYQNIITGYLGVDPVLINSALLSAQDRKRSYWFNWKIEQPKNKNILLKDILINDGNYTEYPINENFIYTQGRKIGYFNSNSQGNRVYTTNGKSVTLCGSAGGMGGKTGLYLVNGIPRSLSALECERLQTVPDGHTKGVSENQRKKMLGNGWTVDVISHILSYTK